MEPVVMKREADQLHVVLGEDMDIAQTGALYQALTGALDAQASIALDATRVQRIDTAVLQLLVAFTRSAGAGGVAVAWTGCSETFNDASRLAGLLVSGQGR